MIEIAFRPYLIAVGCVRAFYLAEEVEKETAVVAEWLGRGVKDLTGLSITIEVP